MNRAVLVIDSASDCMVVGFAGEDGIPVLRSHVGARDHTQELLQLVNAVCAGRQAELDTIAVVRGPGAYTGLRVGIATAQGLALGLGIPAEGIGTLDAVEAAARDLGVEGPLTAVHPAGRGDFAARAFDANGQGGEMFVVAGDELVTAVAAGEGAGQLGCLEVSAEQRCIAAVRLTREGRTGPADAVYVREPHITLPRKTTIGGPTDAAAPANTED